MARSSCLRRIVFLGPPGSGKGTYAKLCAPKLGVPHLSTGDVIRDAIQANTGAIQSEIKEIKSEVKSEIKEVIKSEIKANTDAIQSDAKAKTDAINARVESLEEKTDKILNQMSEMNGNVQTLLAAHGSGRCCVAWLRWDPLPLQHLHHAGFAQKCRHEV